MGYLEEYEWILLNEIAYNISFIYKFENMKNEILIWLKSLIGFDGALITKVQEKSEDKTKKTGEKNFISLRQLAAVLMKEQWECGKRKRVKIFG